MRIFILTFSFLALFVFATRAQSESIEDSSSTTTWRPAEQTPNPNLGGNDLVLLSETDGWQVGNGGRIWRLRNGEWVSVASPTTQRLTTVRAINANDVWAAGDTGTLLRWNGSVWSIVPFPTTDDITTFDMVDAQYGMVLACHYPVSFATSCNNDVYVWDGNDWQKQPDPLFYNSGDIDLLSPTAGWAAAEDDIFQWDGTAWTSNTINALSAGNMRGIKMLSESEGYAFAASLSKVLRWDGNSWELLVNGPGRTFASAFAINSVNDIWVVGLNGLLAHYDGATWTEQPYLTGAEFKAVEILPTGETWAIGHDGTVHVVAGQVEAQLAPARPDFDMRISAMDGVAADNLWAVGGIAYNQIIHWDGTRWTLAWNPRPVGIQFDIAMVSADEGYMVGCCDSYYHFEDGRWYRTAFTGEAAPISSMRSVDAVPGFAVATGIRPHNDDQVVDEVYALENGVWQGIMPYDEAIGNVGAVKVLAHNVVVVLATTGEWIYNGSSWTPYDGNAWPSPPEGIPSGDCSPRQRGSNEGATVWWVVLSCPDRTRFARWTNDAWQIFEHTHENPYLNVTEIEVFSADSAWAAMDNEWFLIRFDTSTVATAITLQALDVTSVAHMLPLLLTFSLCLVSGSLLAWLRKERK